MKLTNLQSKPLRTGLTATGAILVALGALPTSSNAQVAPPSPASFLGMREPADESSRLSDEQRIRETIALYARAVDSRDIVAFRKIFTPDVLTENFLRRVDGGVERSKLPAGHSVDVLTTGLSKLAAGKSMERVHHFTHDPIIEIHGDTAHLNVQFLVTRSRPLDTIPADAVGSQGTVTPELTGYYDDVLKKVGGRWLISEHRVIVDLPFRFPK